MRIDMPVRTYTRVRLALLALPILLRGQDTPPVPAAPAPTPYDASDSSSGPLRLKWVSIGFRVPLLLQPEIRNRTITTTTSTPQTTTTYTTVGSTPRVGLGLAFEFPLPGKFTIASEVLFHHSSYSQEHKYIQGDSSSTSATRTTWTERTKASQWEFPVMLRYNGLRRSGLLSKMYVAAGGVLRITANVRTGTDYSLEVPDEDTVTDYNEIRITPAHRNAAGSVFAVGFRFMDELHVRVTPEIRYIRWSNKTFDAQSTSSSLNQLQAGIALTF
jgi:hypothetical protein